MADEKKLPSNNPSYLMEQRAKHLPSADPRIGLEGVGHGDRFDPKMRINQVEGDNLLPFKKLRQTATCRHNKFIVACNKCGPATEGKEYLTEAEIASLPF